MKAREAQLLGVLALVATGIVFAGLWAGSESGSPVETKTNSTQKASNETSTTLADNQQSRPSAKGREQWLKSSDDSTTQNRNGGLNEVSLTSSDSQSEDQWQPGSTTALGGGSQAGSDNGTVLQKLASNAGTGSDAASRGGSETGLDRLAANAGSDSSAQASSGSTTEDKNADGSGQQKKSGSGQIELGGTEPEAAATEKTTEQKKEEAIERQDRQISSTLDEKDPREVPIVEKDELNSGGSGTPQTTTHEVKKGETLAAISRQYYDTPARWKQIRKANSMVMDSPRDLQPGMELTIPAESDSSASTPGESGGGLPEPSGADLKEGPNGHAIYKVKAEDTLYDISKEYYGNGGLWRHILNANSDVLDDPSDLRKGMKLILP